MSEVESRAAALERFDAAAAAFRQALIETPDGALDHLPPGEDYALGGLVFHVNAVLRHYTGTAEAMLASGFGETSPPDSERLFASAAERARGGLRPSERDAALAETAALHGRARARFESAAPGDWERMAPVRFGVAEPYPTRLADVAGWLTDHYLEHVEQIRAMVAGWVRVAGP